MPKKTELSLSDINKFNIFFLTGEDRFSLKQDVNKIVSNYISNELKDFNYSNFTDENINPEYLSSELHSLPVMSDKRVVHLSNIDNALTDTQNLIKLFLKKNIDTTVLILSGKKPDKRKAFFKDLGKNKKILSFEYKKKNEKDTISWITNYFEKSNRTIDNEALKLLFFNLNGDMNNIASELDKIVLFTETSNSKIITSDIIQDVLGISKEYNIFTLLNSISQKKIENSYKIVSNLLKLKENRIDPIAINLFISKCFVSAYKISSYSYFNNKSIYDSANILGFTNMWRDKDTINCAQNYSLKEINNIMRYLLECDIKLKSSYQSKDNAVFVLIEKIIQQSNKNTGYLKFFNKVN